MNPVPAVAGFTKPESATALSVT